MTLFAALLIGQTAGCDGHVGELTPDDAGTADPGSTGSQVFTAGDAGGGFVLLPFRIRLRRVADVAGVSTDDALLEPLVRARVDLGDYDFATGVAPDSEWSAARMSVWVRALRPLCQSPAMHTRYPDLAGADLPALVEAAYGRAFDPADRADLEAGLAGLTLDEAGRYQAACLAVLSSAEFVVQ